MKILEFYGVKEEDYLRLKFEGTFGSRSSLESELEPFLQGLEKYAGGWMPDVVQGKRRRKYNRAAIWKGLDEARDGDSTAVGFYRTKWPVLDMDLWLWLPPRIPELHIIIKVKPLSFFSVEEHCRPFVEMVRAWASRYPVSYAVARSSDDGEVAGAPRFGRDMQTSIRDGFDKIYEVSWLNVFGPKLVESVGRERMLSTPAWRVEELPNGSIFLVTRPTPADFASDEARLAQARAHVHLRPDLDFDTVLRGLRERSALLAPVEPRFPPDVEPFLSRVVERISSHVRSRKIAEFNAWRPPEPDEWRPADSALPPDVEEVERARAHYRYLAEHLVALLHTKVPSVFDTTPESLSDVDYEFWHQEFPRVFEREKLDTLAVPAIGAYLGEVLVRHLGGQWIPRQKLEEAQVRVGDRVWLPFVRAWRYMRTCQSLLDFSLTQLYHVAEKHRAAG
ncbi:hypothetical protein CYFUS_000760 [Cystobacter fuscus]|uniref:Uncharacterized protein n=1 Tax=Cystobacter fuscus TaxID=43 RepID=A0A250IVP6_9BACT|nr:hypothetical protein [Cystobacter fuscus]ATB35348.1 hypothetical protein CYFUS_000760 [Cystobacter fuscus]